MIKDVICPDCNYAMVCDDTTIYLKCPCCDKVLINKKLDKNETLVIVDYGIEHCLDGDYMWADVIDSYGNTCRYWKERC